jgi:periplasmic divalent cation tolerance protein
VTETAITIVLVTVPSRDVAEALTTTVVDERLAACGNIIPGITSIYRWQDAVQKDEELLIVFKTRQQTAARLMARVQELHPYEVPEAVALPVMAGLPPYLTWVAANAGTDSDI